MCSGADAGSYLRLIDSCITQLKAQGPSKKKEEGLHQALEPHVVRLAPEAREVLPQRARI